MTTGIKLLCPGLDCLVNIGCLPEWVVNREDTLHTMVGCNNYNKMEEDIWDGSKENKNHQYLLQHNAALHMQHYEWNTTIQNYKCNTTNDTITSTTIQLHDTLALTNICTKCNVEILRDWSTISPFSFLFFSFLFFLFNLPQVEQLTVIQCVGGLFKGGWVIQLWDDLGKMWR